MMFYCIGILNKKEELWFCFKRYLDLVFLKKKGNYFLLGFDEDDYLFFNVFFEIFFLKLLLLNLFLKNFVFKVGILNWDFFVFLYRRDMIIGWGDWCFI